MELPRARSRERERRERSCCYVAERTDASSVLMHLEGEKGGRRGITRNVREDKRQGEERAGGEIHLLGKREK